MANNHEFITRGNEVFLLTEETQTVSLAQAVGTLAIGIYADIIDLKNAKDKNEKKELEKKILFRSKCLDSMANALTAVRPYLN